MFLNRSLYLSVFSTDTEIFASRRVMWKGLKDREDTDRRIKTSFRGVNGKHPPENGILLLMQVLEPFLSLSN